MTRDIFMKRRARRRVWLAIFSPFILLVLVFAIIHHTTKLLIVFAKEWVWHIKWEWSSIRKEWNRV